MDDPFRLSIDLTEREHSVDFHANSFEVRVDGNEVHYEGPYGEGTRGVFGTRTVAFELTDEQRARLRRELESYDLRRSVEETFDAGADGPHRELEAEATVVVDGGRHDLRIAGTTRVRGERTDMEHLTQAEGLRWLCFQFKRWAEEADAGAWWNPFG